MKKKIIIPIMFVLIITIAMFSGCIDFDPTDYICKYPVGTMYSEIKSEKIELHGNVAEYTSHILIAPEVIYICSSMYWKFVYDTESHDNWQDYNNSVDAYRKPDCPYNRFMAEIDIDEFEPGVEYHYRFVAYCYGFMEYLIEKFPDGWYPGGDIVFRIF